MNPPVVPQTAPGTMPPLVHSMYYALSREESTGRSVVSLMFPDVGQYTICVGARRLDTAGRPASASFALITAYQCTVSFVPTNEPLMPTFLEPVTVAKLIAPGTSRVTSGNVYMAVSPTLPRVVAVAVVNHVAAVVVKPMKLDASASVAAPAAAVEKMTTEARTQIYYLPWDSATATFNGTCKLETGSVEIWLGFRPDGTNVANLETLVPSHLLPAAFSATSASLLMALTGTTPASEPIPLIADANQNDDDVKPPTAKPLPKSAFDVLQQIHSSTRALPGASTVPFSAVALSNSCRPLAATSQAPVDEPQEKAGKNKGKKGAAPVAAIAPPVIVKEKPLEFFLPFVADVTVARRVPSKETSLLTNNFSHGTETAPHEPEDYVPPPSLLYLAPTTATEHRVAHGILARTVDEETAGFVSAKKTVAGSVFNPK